MSTPMNLPILAIDDAQLATELMPWSDGRMWDGEVVSREIGHYSEVAINAAYEVGRRLIWTKKLLGHGQFEAWCEQNVSHLGDRTRRQYMQLAEFLIDKPKLVAPMAAAGLKRSIRLLTQAPDQAELLLAQSGLLPQADIEGMSELPYVELRKKLDVALKEIEGLNIDLKARDSQLAKRNEELLEATTIVRNADDEAVAARIAEVKKALDRAFGGLAVLLDQSSAAYPNLNTATRADLFGLVEAARRRAEVESLRFRANLGEDIHGAEWKDLLTPYPGRDRHPSDGRVPAEFKA